MCKLSCCHWAFFSVCLFISSIVWSNDFCGNWKIFAKNITVRKNTLCASLPNSHTYSYSDTIYTNVHKQNNLMDFISLDVDRIYEYSLNRECLSLESLNGKCLTVSDGKFILDNSKWNFFSESMIFLEKLLFNFLKIFLNLIIKLGFYGSKHFFSTCKYISFLDRNKICAPIYIDRTLELDFLQLLSVNNFNPACHVL